MKGNVVLLPADAPKEGETYRHYKGDSYRVKLLALHSNDDEWMVVYEPLYENPDAPFFTRPLREWREAVEWGGESYRTLYENLNNLLKRGPGQPPFVFYCST